MNEPTSALPIGWSVRVSPGGPGNDAMGACACDVPLVSPLVEPVGLVGESGSDPKLTHFWFSRNHYYAQCLPTTEGVSG